MPLKLFNKALKAAAVLSAALIAVNMSFFGINAEDDAGNITLTGGGAAVTDQAEGLGYAARLYDATNGLPTSDANTIYSTSDGFIWIGGYSGLIRYDGTSFVRLDSSEGITNARTLYEDSLGRLWVGTNDNGIVVRKDDFSRHYTYADGLRSSTIRSITGDGSGNILIGTTQGVCYADSDLILHYPEDHQLENEYIIRLVSDTGGTVYGNTRRGTFFRIKDLRVTDYYNGSDLGIGDVTTICPDPDNEGYVYLGTETGIICHGSFDDNFTHLETVRLTAENDIPVTNDAGEIIGTETETAEITDSINYITFAAGRLWVLNNDSAAYRDENGKFHILENIPMNSSIDSMIEDYEGNLWFSSSRQGVMKIVANKFTDITDHAGLEPNVVNSTCLYNGDLYIGTDTGLQILNSESEPVTNELSEYIGNARIRCIMEDNAHDLWISTYTNELGLVRFTHDGEIIGYTEENGLLSNKTRCTSLAPDGAVLAATNGGLNVIRDGKIEKSIGAEQGMSNTVILTAAASDDGKYYLGSDGDGIYVIEGNKLSRIGREDGLTSDVILRIKWDGERGVYWVITSNSIEYIKDGVITQVEEFPYTNNYDIYFDSDGNAWVLASNGIYVAKADDMIANGTFEYMFYDLSGGLPSVPNGNSFSCPDDDGTLYISGRGGVFSVNINRYFEQTHDIKFSVPYVEADDILYYPDASGKITIPYSAKVVTVYGYALTYSMHNPQIQYFLSGFDSQPTSVYKSEMEPVRYTNLRGGEYQYQISLVNNSTHAVQQTMSIKIVKEKAFYEMAGFYVVIGGILLVLVYALIQFYVHRKTKALLKNEEKNKTFIREMIEAFAKTVDMKDKYTNGHSKRVAEYTAILTRELGYDEKQVEDNYNIALLHDIGKIGVPSEVLNKPGKLTDEEFRIIKSHAELGYNVLKDISIMPDLAIGAGSHHERPDGKGYPNGLKGNEIPRVAQIIAVADTFDAMYSNRPYRKRMNFEKVVSIIKGASGTQLTPDVVEAFLRLVDKGEFRDPDDDGGGTTEDIDNIHKRFNAEKTAENAENKENESKENENKDSAGKQTNT